MKKCPTCQRTFTDDNLTFCLDDGAPLWVIDPGWATHQTAVMPEARPTNPHEQVFHPVTGTGFQFSNRNIAMIGASLLTVGIFMPVVSFLGLISVSYFQLLQFSASFFTGILLLLIGVGGFVFALVKKYRPLLVLGIAAIAILVIDFFRIKSAIAGGLPIGLPGAPPGVDRDILGQALSSIVQISWGVFVMFAGAIMLIVAGVKKERAWK